DLPPLDADPAEPATLELAAAMLWLREIEAAGMPAFVEAVADAVAGGRLAPTDQQGLAELLRFHRREHHFHAPERAELYARVFPADFDAALRRFAELLVERTGPTSEAYQARARIAAEQLAQDLAPRVSG